MRYLQRKFSFAAGTPQISDEDWAAAFRREPECLHHWAFDGEHWFCLLCAKLQEEVNVEVKR